MPLFLLTTLSSGLFRQKMEALTFVPKLNKSKNHENGPCADVSYFGFVATTNGDKTLSISSAQGTINLVVFFSTH